MNTVSLVIKVISILVFVLIPTIANTQTSIHVERTYLRNNFDFDDKNWNISYWEHWTTEQRESYLAGVRDTAEAISFHMARGVGPKELLHSIVKLLIEPRDDMYNYMYSRYEPTGSGRLTHWLSREVVGVMRNKDYIYAPIYLRNNDIGSD